MGTMNTQMEIVQVEINPVNWHGRIYMALRFFRLALHFFLGHKVNLSFSGPVKVRRKSFTNRNSKRGVLEDGQEQQDTTKQDSV